MALVVSGKSEHVAVAVVVFVTVVQIPQSEVLAMLYCRVEQLEMTEVQLNTSFPGWTLTRLISLGGG